MAFPPSLRIIQDHFQFASHTSSLKHLRALSAKGAVTKLRDNSWGIKPVELQGMNHSLPIYGAIPAGLPDEREQEVIERIPLDPIALGVGRERRAFLWGLRVSGDSMIGACICDGDIGIFERREARPGDIIAALVDGTTTTLKRLVRTGDRMVLRAENPRYPDIEPKDSIESQGVLVGLIRRTATA